MKSDTEKFDEELDQKSYFSTVFLDHLQELSKRLKNALFAYIVALIVVSSLPDPLDPFGGPYSVFGYNFLLTSLLRQAEISYAGSNFKFFAISPTDPVLSFLDISMVVALVVSLPYIFYEIYGFVTPGLYPKERKSVRKYLLPFVSLFALGSIFGLFVILPLVMHILLMFYAPLGVANLVSLTGFVNLLLIIPLATGLSFTFPVILIPLVEFGLVSVKQLSSWRKWVYLLVALGVSIANPDPTDISSIPIIVPVFILYEVTILISKRIEKKRSDKILKQMA